MVRPSPPDPSTPRFAAPARTDTGPPALEVDFAGGTVSVRARDASLSAVLAEIARQGGLAVVLDGPLAERVTMTLERLPLRQALDRILRGQSFILRYVDPPPLAGTYSGRHPNTLWVFAQAPGGFGGRSAADGHARAEAGVAAATCDRAGGPGAAAAGPCLETLSPGLTADDPRVRLRAVSELAELGSDRAAEALAAAALSDTDPAVREEAVYGLGAIGGDTGLHALERALHDPDFGVRRAAVDAVADVGGDGSAWALATALDDRDAALREQAVYLLGEIGGEAAITILQRALADEEDSIREAATEVLDELSSADR